MGSGAGGFLRHSSSFEPSSISAVSPSSHLPLTVGFDSFSLPRSKLPDTCEAVDTKGIRQTQCPGIQNRVHEFVPHLQRIINADSFSLPRSELSVHMRAQDM